jgi:outer membrane biogenesis lipoprotein LolB
MHGDWMHSHYEIMLLALALLLLVHCLAQAPDHQSQEEQVQLWREKGKEVWLHAL